MREHRRARCLACKSGAVITEHRALGIVRQRGNVSVRMYRRGSQLRTFSGEKIMCCAVLCSAGDASWDVHPAVALGRSRQVALCSGVSAAKPNVPGNLFDTSPLAMCSRSHATAARHGALSPRTRRVVVSAPDAVPFEPMPLPEASGQHRKRHWSPGRDPNATTIRSGR
jgi:hypothetical protein